MTASEFFLGPDRDLSRDEIEALLHIKAGVKVSEWAYQRLETVDLIKKGLSGWRLTEAGQLRLSAGK